MSQNHLAELAADTVRQALEAGAGDAECTIAEGSEFSANVRLREVETLKTHPDFDIRNPNRVRALISGFAGNQVRFHDPSGEGYRLYAGTIIQLDPANAQLAARMVSPLGQWRRFDPARQDLMKRELRRILDLPKLSANTFEMASKSIE